MMKTLGLTMFVLGMAWAGLRAGADAPSTRPATMPASGIGADFTFSRLEEKGGIGNFPTFGSFNIHLAQVKGAYYAAYMQRDNMANPAHVRVKRSLDGGNTWEMFYAGDGGKVDYTELPPVLATDRAGRLHMVWADSGYGRYARFSGNPLKPTPDIVKADMGPCNSKWAMVYNPARDVLHWSRRDWGTNLHVLTLGTSGMILSDSEVVKGVGDWADCTVDHWDAQYQALSVDPAGRLHMIYNPHVWPAGGDSSKQRNTPYKRVRVQYVYSDDGGRIWNDAPGDKLALPLRADQTGKGSGAMLNLETEKGVSISSVLATSGQVHAVYWSTSANSLEYVRMNRATGGVERNTAMKESGLMMHTSFVEDAAGKRLYLVGEKQIAAGSCTIGIQESSDGGDTWTEVPVAHPRLSQQGGYFATTVYPWLTPEGAIMGMTTDFKIPDQRSYVEPVWFKFQIRAKP